ncbi:MAG: serine protein kinase RIO [Promethearchaeota archaeon]
MKNEEEEMEDEGLDEEMDEDENSNMLSKLQSKVDELEVKQVDSRRIRIIDQSKKRAAIESVFDERTLFLLNKILKNGPLSDIIGIISAGKEANVYLAHDQEGEEVAVKIYKIDSNTSRWMRNYIIGDPRFKKIPHNVSKVIYLWASKEFKNLKRAHEAGLSVPKPIYIRNNILIMEYIGFDTIPAPKLKDIREPRNIDDLAAEIFKFIKDLYQKARLVHGDLSEFNILYHNQRPIVIDISQAVDIRHPKAEVFLVRDIRNMINYFEKFEVELPDPEKFYYEIINFE